MRAAAAATAALAFDEAVAALRTALGLGVPDARERAEIQLALGVACYRGGHGTEALVAYRAAADIARDIGDGELFAAGGGRLRELVLADGRRRGRARSSS